MSQKCNEFINKIFMQACEQIKQINRSTVKKYFSRLIVALSWLLLAPMAGAQPTSIGYDDIVILYENDVHGAIEGYPLMAAMRDQMMSLTPHVVVVSCGDFLSGTPLGSVSRGRYLIRMMNAVGYDYVTLGNHEFDFGIDTLVRRMSELSARVLCGNFASVDGTSYFLCNAISQFDGVKVAFVGVTTPHVPTSSTPMFFQDSAGRWLYTFYPNSLDSVVQRCVDEVREKGADYVVLLSHLGDFELPPLVAATEGIDVVLDGHSHSVIPHTQLLNRKGKEVLWTSTGSKFHNIGRLVIPRGGRPHSELLPSVTVPHVINAAFDTLQAVQQAYDSIARRRVGYNQVLLWRKGYYEDSRIDSPLGNYFCDAFLTLTKDYHADVALMNAGGMRDDIRAGELLFGDLYAAAPFDNQLCVVETSGQSILDALEMGCRKWPKVSGEFLYVAGLQYEIDTMQKSTVVCDENGVLIRIEGARKVKNVMVVNPITQELTPLDPKKVYRVAGCDYTLLKEGDGHRFPDAKVINPAICSYVEAIERYLHDHLNGVIDPSMYAHPLGRIIAR